MTKNNKKTNVMLTDYSILYYTGDGFTTIQTHFL